MTDQPQAEETVMEDVNAEHTIICGCIVCEMNRNRKDDT